MLWQKVLLSRTSVPIEFISSSTNRASSATSLVVTAPTGIQDGDLLVCVFYAATVAASTLPSGFASDYADTASNPRINVGWKLASSEPSSYTFTPASSSNLTASILVYRNAEFDITGTITRSATTTVSASSISPATPGILIAAFTTNGITATVSSAPSGMTLRANTTGSVSAPSLAVYDEEILNSGATGTRSITWSAGTVTSGIQLFINQ